MSVETVDIPTVAALRATGEMTVDVAELRRLMPALKSVAGGRVAVPCMGWVRFSAGKLTVFDFETSISSLVSDDATLYGAISFADLARAVAIMPKKGTTRIAASADGLRVHVGDLAVDAQDVTDLAELPDIATASYLATLTPAHVAEALRVGLAAGRDDTVPILTAMQVTVENGSAVSLVATDRYRLHFANLTGCEAGPLAKSWLVSAKTFEKVAKLAKGLPLDILTVGESYESMTVYRAGGVTVTHREPGGEYPRWNRLIPDGGEIVTLDRAQLIEAVRKASAVLTRNVPVRIEVKVNGADIVAYQYGELLRIHVDGCGADGEIGAFSPSYLLDALGALTGETVSASSNRFGKDASMFIGSGDGLTRALIMPVRLSH